MTRLFCPRLRREEPLNCLRDEIHAIAREKGWWSKSPKFGQRSSLEIHALIHSEISEATECARTGEPPFYLKKDRRGAMKPEGEAVELVDAIIRILDYAGARRWDIDRIMAVKIAFNRTRNYRHGGKLA